MNIRFFTNSSNRTAGAAALTLMIGAMSSSSSAEIKEDELNRFVRGYLEAAEQATPNAEVDHYAARVRYFDSGTVDHDFVAADQRRYYKLWPDRSFELLDGPVITEHDDDSATVKFVIRYEVKGGSRRATGMTENTMGVRRYGDELRIVAMSERKLNARDLPRPSGRSGPETRTPEPKSSPPPPQRSSTASVSPPASVEKRPATRRDAPVEQTREAREEADRVKAQANAVPKMATPVPETPGFVYPPGTEHTPKNMIDVRGYASGQKVKDPRTGQIFVVP